MSKYDLSFSPPLLNAAGSLGFAPDPRGPAGLSWLGAFITNPVSLRARTPAHGPRLQSFPGGFLLHTGHPNPGLRETIRRFAHAWRRAPLPVLVHVLAESPGEVAELVAVLESIEGVFGIELGIPPGAGPQVGLQMVSAAAGELPLVVHLPLDRAVELAPSFAAAGEAITALSLGPPRGTLPAGDGGLVHGRLYGPALFPLALQALHPLAKVGLPVVAAGGVYSPQQAETMLAAGAAAVQLDSVLWRRGLEEWKAGSL